MSCTAQNGKTKKIETIEVVDSIKRNVIDILNKKHHDSLSQKNIIVEPTIDGEMIVGKIPIEPVTIDGFIIIEDHKNEEPIPISMVDELPKFPNTPTNLSKIEEIKYFGDKISGFVKDNFNTKQLTELNLKGKQRINVMFEINEKGFVNNIKIRAIHFELGNEAENVIKKLPQFIPAKQNNKEVTVRYALPIIFTLDD